MSTSLELKVRIRALEERVKALEARPQGIVSQETLVELAKLEALNRQEPTRIEVNRKLCPHCGIKPNHFFHVRSCGKQKEEKTHGDDGNRSTSRA